MVLRVVFMGTPDFAVPCLNALVAHHEVAAVITQPDKPVGRGRKVRFSPVKEEALRKNILVLQPEKIRDPEMIETLRSFQADVFIVAAYGQLLPETVLTMPPFGCINVHGSLLPKYRGAAPIQWAVLNGEEKTGVTIMQMDKGLDTGDMLFKKEIPILPEDTGGSLHDKMAVLGAEALMETLEMLQKGNIKREKQDAAFTCYAPRLTRETGHINWQKSTKEIIHFIRGLNPWPAAYTYYNPARTGPELLVCPEGKSLSESERLFKIWAAENYTYPCGHDGQATGVNRLEASDFPEEKASVSVVPGQILDVFANRGIVVATGDGAILITVIQAEGGKAMSAADYMRGHSLEKGTVLR